MLSDAGSPETYPGVQHVIELLDSVIDQMSSRSPECVMDEEEFDLTESTFNPIWEVHGGSVEVEFHSIDFDDNAASPDDEIEHQLQSLAKNKQKLASSAAFASKALKVKPDTTSCSIHTEPEVRGVCAACGCNDAVNVACPMAWCPKHEDLLINSIREDFRKETIAWPRWLQQKIHEFAMIELSADEILQVLHDVAVPRLRELKPRTEEEALSLRDLLKAITTYKARFNHIPRVSSLYLTLSITMLFAFASSVHSHFAPAVVFSSAAGTALTTILLGVGARRSRALIIPTGYAAMIGASVGMLSLGLS